MNIGEKIQFTETIESGSIKVMPGDHGIITSIMPAIHRESPELYIVRKENSDYRFAVGRCHINPIISKR